MPYGRSIGVKLDQRRTRRFKAQFIHSVVDIQPRVLYLKQLLTAEQVGIKVSDKTAQSNGTIQMGSCSLCGARSRLVKSHIIPEWAYGPLFDKSHRIMRIKSNAHKVFSYRPSGEYDRVLCGACEEQMAKLDEYGRSAIYSTPDQQTFGMKTGPNNLGLEIINLDYARMKLFQLSILWRASVSRREFFAELDLGTNASVIKEMLFKEQPGNPDDFGCMIVGIQNEAGQLEDKFILPPTMYKIEGWNIARFYYAGCL